eukprot:TRINITY_DN5914_c0_g1_i1.p1 TRINITY_DN5914_c0_g1~~TRINITY_DN5914_c0_g1_i1.p1  ORF type:complete len:227 (-),score=30.66 TRINITY_DN5914_c0_g1_i1:109-789(-)
MQDARNQDEKGNFLVYHYSDEVSKEGLRSRDSKQKKRRRSCIMHDNPTWQTDSVAVSGKRKKRAGSLRWKKKKKEEVPEEQNSEEVVIGQINPLWNVDAMDTLPKEKIKSKVKVNQIKKRGKWRRRSSTHNPATPNFIRRKSSAPELSAKVVLDSSGQTVSNENMHNVDSKSINPKSHKSARSDDLKTGNFISKLRITKRKLREQLPGNCTLAQARDEFQRLKGIP